MRIWKNHTISCRDGLAPSLYNNQIRIKLSKIGQIINEQWNNIQNQYENIALDQILLCLIISMGLFILIMTKMDITKYCVPT